MDNFVDERDYKLIEVDKYTFFVLGRIMGGQSTLLLSDHEKLIICFTGNPFPVWIWTPDNASQADLERAYTVAKENGLMDGAHRFNIKYELAEYFIKRAAKDGLMLNIETNMFAYDNPNPIAPETVCDGALHKCVGDDEDIIVEFMDLFHNELDIDKESLEAYRERAKQNIEKGSLYLWKNAEGKPVASCSYNPNGEMASIGLVYTKKEHRRKHYAEHLVYEVTKIAGANGYLPMLYTDADYVASNACYEKIGYILRGKLCTIG